MSERPIVVFDVNETLLELDTLRPTFDRIFDDPAALRLWFAGLITYSEALTLAGVYGRCDLARAERQPIWMAERIRLPAARSLAEPLLAQTLDLIRRTAAAIEGEAPPV